MTVLYNIYIYIYIYIPFILYPCLLYFNLVNIKYLYIYTPICEFLRHHSPSVHFIFLLSPKRQHRTTAGVPIHQTPNSVPRKLLSPGAIKNISHQRSHHAPSPREGITTPKACRSPSPLGGGGGVESQNKPVTLSDRGLNLPLE